MLTVSGPGNESGRLDRSQALFSHDFSHFSTTNLNSSLLQRFLNPPAAVTLHVPNKFNPNFVLWAIILTVRIMAFSPPVPVVSSSADVKKQTQTAYLIGFGQRGN